MKEMKSDDVSKGAAAWTPFSSNDTLRGQVFVQATVQYPWVKLPRETF